MLAWLRIPRQKADTACSPGSKLTDPVRCPTSVRRAAAQQQGPLTSDSDAQKARLSRLCPDWESEDPVLHCPVGPVYEVRLQQQLAACAVPEAQDLGSTVAGAGQGLVPTAEGSWTSSADQDVAAVLEQLPEAPTAPQPHGLLEQGGQEQPQKSQQQPQQQQGLQPPGQQQQQQQQAVPGTRSAAQVADTTTSLGGAPLSTSSEAAAAAARAAAGSFYPSRTAMLQQLQVRQRQLMVDWEAKQGSSKLKYRYCLQDGMIAKAQQAFPHVKLPTAGQGEQEQRQQEAHALGAAEGPPSRQPQLAAAAAAAAGGGGTLHHSSAGPLWAQGELWDQQQQQQWQQQEDVQKEEEQDEQQQQQADGAEDVLSDMEALAQLLLSEDAPGDDQELLQLQPSGQESQKGLPGLGFKPLAVDAGSSSSSNTGLLDLWQLMEGQQVVQEADSWLDWRPADPLQVQQYSQLLEAAGEGGMVAPRELVASPVSAEPSPPAAAGSAGTGSSSTGALGPTHGLTLAVFVYCLPAKRLKQLLWELQLPLSCIQLVTRVADADVVLHCLPQPGEKQFQYDAYRAQAKQKGIPFLSLKTTTAAELERWLLPVFALYAGQLTPEQVARRPAARGRRGGQLGKRYRPVKL